MLSRMALIRAVRLGEALLGVARARLRGSDDTDANRIGSDFNEAFGDSALRAPGAFRHEIGVRV
jgi:hypothetical protein